MTNYVAFIRGINVGGHNKLPMADLRKVLTENGFHKVSTYIQSGNVLFESDKDCLWIEEAFERLLLEHFNLDVKVMLRTHAELESILNGFPFSKEHLSSSYFVLLKKEPDKALIQSAEAIELPFDQFKIISKTLYLFPEQGYGKSKFNLKRFESILNVRGTARNYKTMTKLVSLPLK